LAVLLGGALLVVPARVAAQVRIMDRARTMTSPVNHGLPDRPAGFTFCRLRYDMTRRIRKTGWSDDYPASDFNFMERLQELTTVSISHWADGDPGFAQVQITDPDLFRCPFIKMQNAADHDFTPEETARLREYLLKGGFLWEDDNWTDYDWAAISANLQKILPDNPIIELTPDHPLFSVLYHIDKVPRIPSIESWRGGGYNRWESGPGSDTPHLYAIFGADNRLMVLVSMNSDISDSWEREGDNPDYFYEFSPEGYAIGVNVLVWVMSH
jgi:Domain of unknown function (DUF4159)